MLDVVDMSQRHESYHEVRTSHQSSKKNIENEKSLKRIRPEQIKKLHLA